MSEQEPSQELSLPHFRDIVARCISSSDNITHFSTHSAEFDLTQVGDLMAELGEEDKKVWEDLSKLLSDGDVLNVKDLYDRLKKFIADRLDVEKRSGFRRTFNSWINNTLVKLFTDMQSHINHPDKAPVERVKKSLDGVKEKLGFKIGV